VKKNIKKYNDFINESEDERRFRFAEINKIKSEREDFDTLVRELHDEMYVGRRSYSDLCKTNQDPEQDFNDMQSYMDSKGFTIEKIKDLFSEQNNEMCGNDIVYYYNRISDLSATVDVYFYKLFEKLGLDENIVSLGGGGWCDWENAGDDEALIRYKYGYHQTKYGQLMLKQCGKTAEDLKSEAMADLKSEVKNDFDSIISQIIRKVTGKRIELSLKYDDYVVLDTDRMIIFCDEIAKKINQNISDITRFTNRSVDVEDVSSEFVKELSWFKLSENDDSIQLIDGDLILHGDFGL